MSAPERQPPNNADENEAVVSSTTGDSNDAREEAASQPRVPVLSLERVRVNRYRVIWRAPYRRRGITIQRSEENQYRLTNYAADGSQGLTIQTVEGNNYRAGDHGFGRLVFVRSRNGGNRQAVNPRENNEREAMAEERNGDNEQRVNPRGNSGRILGLPHKTKFSTQPATTDTLKCNYCRHSFETVSEMRKHMNSPFQRAACMRLCTGCSSLYQGDSHNTQERVLSSLSENILLMDLETPDSYICTTCNEVFKTVAGMRLHRTKIHLVKENRSVQCSGCHEIFPTIQHFTLHKSKCLREIKDRKGLTEDNIATHSSISTEQSHNSANGTDIRAPTNIRNFHSFRPNHSKNAALAETAHSASSHVSVPSTSSQAPDDSQQPPKKRRSRLPPTEQELEPEASYAQNVQKPAVNDVSSSPIVPDALRNLLLHKKDRKTLNSHHRANESSTPQCEQVEERNLLPSGGNYGVNGPCLSGESYKRNRNSQRLQNGSSVLKKRKYEGNHAIDLTAGPPRMASATVGSEFALKGAHVVLAETDPAGEQCSLLDNEEQAEQPKPKEMERTYSTREEQDANCIGAQLATLSDTKSDCSSTDKSQEETGDQQLSAENVVKQVPMEGEESEVRSTLPQNIREDISKQATDCDISAPVALYTGGISTNSEPSLGNSEVTDVASIDEAREYTEDSDSQMLTDNCDLPTPEDEENENTLQCINTKAYNFISVASITDTLIANDSYRNKKFHSDRINESSSDNEPAANLAVERYEHPLEGCESGNSVQYSLSGTNSSVKNLSICECPSQVEMQHTTDTQVNSKVQPNRIESFGDANTQSASNHYPLVSHPSPHHIMSDNEEKDLCIGSPAQYYTDTDRQIFSNTFFDEILSQGPEFTGEINEEQPDLSLLLNTSDTNDISDNFLLDLAMGWGNNLNHLSHTEETGFHSTDNESCISLQSEGLQQNNTSQNSLFLADQCDTIIDQKILHKSVLLQKTEDSETPKMIFEDDCISETSQSTLDIEEIYLKKINDWETKTASTPETEKADEEQGFSFYDDSNDIICVHQTRVSSKSHNEAGLLSSIFLSDGNHEGSPSTDGSNWETSNTDKTEQGGNLTHDSVTKIITDGREESNCPNSNEGTGESHSRNNTEVSDWLAETIDTEFFMSSDDSQFVDDFISENSSETVGNNGSDSNPATDYTTKSHVLPDGSDWSPLSNNSPLFQDIPLNPKNSPDHGVDLTFDQPADTQGCSIVDDEFLKELISLKFPHLMDFTESGSADEATNGSGTLSFEPLDFDLLLVSPPDHSDWITKPEMAAEEKETETDSDHNPGPSMMEHNEVLVHEAGSSINNLETVNGIGCSTEKNNLTDGTLTEGETRANHNEQATDSMEVDNNTFTHCKPGAPEIISEGSEGAVIATQSPSEQVFTYSNITSTETEQYNMEMDTNPPDQDTIVSLIDSLANANITPSCSTSRYQDATDDASYCVVTEDKEAPIHWKNTASTNSVSYEAEKPVANTNTQKEAKRGCSHVGTSTVSSTIGVSEEVNLSKRTPEICGAQKQQHGDSEITVITKSSDSEENLPPERNLAETAVCRPVLAHTLEVQPATHRGDGRIQQKGGMPQTGNLAGTSNGKSNEILQTEEILAGERPSDSQSSDLSHTSRLVEQSQSKGSAASDISQTDNKSQFASINANSVLAIQRNPLAQKCQEAVLILLPVQSNTTSDGTANGNTVAVNKQERTYKQVAPLERVQPKKKTTATDIPATETSTSRWTCYCGRVFPKARNLHQHQTRCHLQTQLVYEVSKDKCDRTVHCLPHKRYECPCGSIFRSVPAAFDCCLGGPSGQLTLCQCKLPKPQPGPSSLHKLNGTKANKETVSQLQMSENSAPLEPSGCG